MFLWKTAILFTIYHRLSQEPLDQTWACLCSFWCISHDDSKYGYKNLWLQNLTIQQFLLKFSDKNDCHLPQLSSQSLFSVICTIEHDCEPQVDSFGYFFFNTKFYFSASNSLLSGIKNCTMAIPVPLAIYLRPYFPQFVWDLKN